MFYVCLDSNKTQDYVFSSTRLRGIRNASLLLEEADQSAEHLIEKNNGRCIRALGAVVVAEFDNKGDAGKFVSEATASYHLRGISIESAIFHKNTVSNFYTDVMCKLLLELRKKKDSPRTIQPHPPSSILTANCELSGLGPANLTISRESKRERASTVEAIKWDLHRKDELSLKILQAVARKWGICSGELDFGFPKTAEGIVGWHTKELEDAKTKPGSSETRLIGMIFADVNGLGDLLPEIGATKDVYKDFAPELRQCLFMSIVSGLANVFKEAMQARTRLSPDNLALPFRLLYLGGDDLCFLVLGAYALPLINEIIAHFEENSAELLTKVKERLPGANLPPYLTLSAGVALAPYKYPILLFRQLGLELEAHAKLIGRCWAKLHSGLRNDTIFPPSLVDYYLVKNNIAGSLDQVRAVLQDNGNVLFGGPYWAGRNSPPYNDRFEYISKLLDTAKNLADFSAKGKLKLLPNILREGNSSLLYRDWWDHLDDDQIVYWETVLSTLNLPRQQTVLPYGKNNTTTVLDVLDLVPLEELRQRWEKLP